MKMGCLNFVFSSTATIAVLWLLGMGKVTGVTPLSDWGKGIATNYGGAADGLSPDQPSFGTSEAWLL